MWARLWVQPANSANEQSWWESSKIERIWINKASIHPSVSSRRWQSCLLTYVQRKAWGKEKHNAYPSSKAPGPFLPGFLSSYFRSLCVNKYGDSSDLCLPLPNLRADPYGTTPYAVNMGMAQQSLATVTASQTPQIHHQNFCILQWQQSMMQHFYQSVINLQI